MQDSDNKKKTKKEIILLSAFLAVVLITFVVLSLWFNVLRAENPSDVSEVDTPMWECLNEPENTVDVVVIGDSESLGVLIPREFFADIGSTAYLAGGTGRAMSESYYTLKYIFKKQKPKVVIIETNMITDDSRMSEYYQVLQNTVEYYLPIFRTHNVWSILCGNAITWGQTDKGWVSRPEDAEYTGGEYMLDDLSIEQYTIPFVRRFFIDQINKMCEKNNCSLLAITVPSPKNFNNSKFKALKKEFNNLGIDYIDFNTLSDEIGIDWNTDFLDERGDHINNNGTRKVMHYLEKYLKENYSLIDHRGDESYNSWNSN